MSRYQEEESDDSRHFGGTGPRGPAWWNDRMRNCMRDHGGRACRGVPRPVAIIDLRLRRWCSVVGALESQLPEINDALLLACRSEELTSGRAVSWRRPLDPKRVWLLFLIADGLVAFAGFQAPADPPPETVEWDELSAEAAGADLVWGPVCAEPALRHGASRSPVGCRVPGRTHVLPNRDRIPQSPTKPLRSTGSPGDCGSRIHRIISRRWPPRSCERP